MEADLLVLELLLYAFAAHEDVADEVLPLAHEVDDVAENRSELVQFLPLFPNKFFREDESPFLMVFAACKLPSEGKAHHCPFFRRQPGSTDARILQLPLEIIGSKVRLVHLRIEVLTVEPCLHFW